MIISIISGKGGVGKTTSVSNLAVCFSKLNKKILAIDFNLLAPNLGIHFGIKNPDYTIHDVLFGRCSLKDAIYEWDNIHIVPGKTLIEGLDIKLAYNLEKIIRLKERDYDIILLDTSPGYGDDVKAAIDISDKIFVIANPDTPSLVEGLKSVNRANSLGRRVEGLILNKIKGKVDENKIEDVVGVRIYGKIRFDKKIEESLKEELPVSYVYPNSKSAKDYMKLARKILGIEEEKKSLIQKILDLFRW